MDRISSMFEAHPRRSRVDTGRLPAFVLELADCEVTCTLCADACLSEPHVQMLAKCIALNLECADTCAATARTLSRFGFAEPSVTRLQVEACREACGACARECDRHQDMEHCQLCAEMCRRCEQACSRALESMLAGVS
ncbi:MAG: four-helix bundle copper-binding protein [Coriobacteriia bacterium]